MINDRISLQYYEGKGFLNFLHPITKFLGLIIVTIIVLIFSNSPAIQALIFISGLVLLKITGYSFLEIQGGRLVISTAIFIALLQIVFIKSGIILFSLGPIQIHDQGLIQALTISLRFLSIILYSYLFVLSTDPSSFVLALVQTGMPYRFGFSIITAIRMIPMIKSESTRIYSAQITRGASYKLLPIRDFFRSVSQFLNVMIISMIKRVNSLVISMEGRSFGLYHTRTFVNAIAYSIIDRIIIACELLAIPLAIIWRLSR
jgi:energy-coupling factor transport system permease protein